MQFDYLIISHAKPRIGTYNLMEAYSYALAKNTKKKICFISPNENNSYIISKIKKLDNLYFIYLPIYSYHKYFNLQIIRMLCTIGILFFLSYKKVLASGFSQPQISIPCTLAKVLRKKKIFYVWDDIWGNGLGKELSIIINCIFLFFEKVSFLYSNGFVVVSSFHEKLIKRLNLKKKIVSKIYMPYLKKNLDENNNSQLSYRDKHNIPLSCKLIFCMGNSFFGTETILLNTVEYLKRTNLNFKLIIIGNYKPSQFLNIKQKKLVDQYFIITGYISDPKIFYNYMNHADIFLIPMARNLIEIARFPVRIFDYFRYKKLIVTNATGELYRIFTKFNIGILTRPDAKSFAKGIIKGLAMSEKKRKNYIYNRNICIKSIFDEKKTSTKLIKVLESNRI